ncbi:immunity-related GTPase family M protein 1-like isoform X1 [Peromyscus californicus insignis]|uniref:immunity-related GTPase family M protein 1-like isoform X1 n=2 Tax=Peromyscus californicus insignis TaxID=564181 RepID=UPI0022A7D9E9|nr:immunity-related GTPase family M protein 1-like isoform X1 [Peromyscus californicus insignis]
MAMSPSKVAPLLTNMEETVGSVENKEFTCFSDAIPIHKNSSILSVEVVKNIEAAVKDGKLGEVVSIVKDINQEVSRSTVKIAVTGDSGNGMSSFINALRLTGHKEEDSAPTEVVRTTQKPTCYFSSSFPNVDLWDLPGTGVTAQSMENYLEEMEFDKYDLIIIIASEQFSSNHVRLAKAMQRLRKRFYVVWTKLDRDLGTSAHSEPQLLRSIQESIQENLQKEGVKVPPIFLVSSIDPSSHDFLKLRDTLKKDISSIRHDGLLGTLFQICEKTINEKVESISRSIDEDNLKGFGISNPDNLGECQKVFQEMFGVDERSLHQVALNMSQPDACSRDAKPSQVTQRDQQDGWTVSELCRSGTQYVFTSVYSFTCCFDSRRLRCFQLKHALDEDAKQTKKILWKILRVHYPSSEGLDN